MHNLPKVSVEMQNGSVIDVTRKKIAAKSEVFTSWTSGRKGATLCASNSTAALLSAGRKSDDRMDFAKVLRLGHAMQPHAATISLAHKVAGTPPR